MDVVDAVGAMREVLDAHRAEGRSVGFVPTMGALHAGHLSLVGRARGECDVVAASVFVNPLQFGPDEDYDAYPRRLDDDLQRLRDEGVDVVLAPTPERLTPDRMRTTVKVAGLSESLEGAGRPGHFDGVTTIVAKLLNVVQPDRAYFGEKDYQQLVVVRQMVADLAVPVEVVGCPTVRDDDGLALSSRNAYLDAAQRRAALAVPRALEEVAAGFAGELDGDADRARGLLTARLAEAEGLELDYAEVVDADTLEPLLGRPRRPARALVAVLVGGTRLIDNVRLDPPPGD